MTAGNGREFSYDALDRTSSVEKGETVTSFVYDCDDDRVVKTNGNTSTETVLDDGTVSADLVDNTVKVFTDNNSVYCENGVFTYNVVNIKGDLVASAGSNGIEYKYNAYGEKLTSNNTSNPIGYRNYYYDSETGLYYLKARYYDSTTGQFTQEDTVQDDNLQYNLYGYCSGNPVIYIDYTGNCKTAKNLERHYRKKDKNGKHTGKSTWPQKGKNGLKITIKKNVVKIRWRAKFSGKGINKKPSGWPESYKTAIKTGIKSKWSGDYDVIKKHKNIKVNAAVTEVKDSRYGRVVFHNKNGISNAWWSSSVNQINMYKGDDRNSAPTYSYESFKIVAAHEFGHVLGIGDGYIGSPNGTEETAKINSIMCDQWGAGRASCRDINKALNSYKYNKFQEWA